MATRFMLQPDGKLCCFSEIEDNFTHGCCSFEEAVRFAIVDMGLGQRAAEEKVRRGVARDLHDKGGWYDCLAIVKRVHGEKAMNEIVAEMLGENTTAAGESGQ